MRPVAAPLGDAHDPAGWRRRCAAWHDALEAAIDRDTALVALEPAHWTDGTRFDLDRLARRARAVGAAFVVDATQVAGVMPLDVGALQPDALVAHSYKSIFPNGRFNDQVDSLVQLLHAKRVHMMAGAPMG